MNTEKKTVSSPKVSDKNQATDLPNKSEKKGKRKEKKRGKVREKREEIVSHWDELPDLILEQIFSYLSIRDRYNASIVCSTWYEAFYLPNVWSTFIMGDSTLVRRKFNYYMGWQYVLDHMRTQNCLATVGRNIKSLVFEPMYNFYNLYEFMVMLSYYAERNEEERAGKVVYHKGNIIPIMVDVRGGGQGIGARISTLRFTFPCNMAHSDRVEDEYIFGTGGKMLEAFKRLMGSLGRSLRHLQLVDLLLDRHEALYLLDEVCYTGCDTLESLELVNVTKVPCQLLHAGVFINLKVLVLSPHTLGIELLQLLGESTSLRHLHVLQNRYSPERQTSAPWQAWRQCRRNNPQLSVHLEAQNTREGDVVWQQCAPVRSIIYKSPYIPVNTNSVLTAIDQYRSDLEVYGHFGIPRFHRSKSFHERADSLLLLLCRQCPSLHTLMIRERISTATILLLAHTGGNLRYLHIRRNAVILRCDWPRSPEWSEPFYAWLKNASRSYESTEREVSQILGYNWTMLKDRQFKLASINLHQSPFYYNVNRANFHTYVPPPLPTPVAEIIPEVNRRQTKKIKIKKMKSNSSKNEL